MEYFMKSNKCLGRKNSGVVITTGHVESRVKSAIRRVDGKKKTTKVKTKPAGKFRKKQPGYASIQIEVFDKIKKYLGAKGRPCTNSDLADVADCNINQINRFEQGTLSDSMTNLVLAVFKKLEGEKVRLNPYEKAVEFIAKLNLKVYFQILSDNGDFVINFGNFQNSYFTLQGNIRKKFYHLAKSEVIEKHQQFKQTFSRIKKELK